MLSSGDEHCPSCGMMRDDELIIIYFVMIIKNCVIMIDNKKIK